MARMPEGVRLLPTGKYQARIQVTKVVDGKRVTVQQSVGTFTSKTEARDARSVALARQRAGTLVDSADRKLTLGEWAQQWLDARPSTNRTLRSHLNSSILPAWSAMRLEDITTLSVQHWVNGLTARGLAPTTVRDYYDTFRLMLADAVVYKKLGVTPCPARSIKLPKVGPSDIVVLTVEDMLLLEREAPARFRAMIHLGCWAGLRMGELIGLRWQDIDWEGRVLHVQHALKHDGSWGLPKNNKTRRVAVDDVTMAVLRDHRRDFGSGTMDLLFTTGRQNRPLNDRNWRTNIWAPLVKSCGLDPAPTPHDMRHGHAGVMVMQGMDWKVLSDRLGHHKPSFTMDRYGWARPDSHEVTLAALERARMIVHETTININEQEMS